MKSIGVASIKGGVGKTTVATNLAFALRDRGFKVGLLDCDIDSPHLVETLRVVGKISLDKSRRMIPVEHDGMRVMGFPLWTPTPTAAGMSAVTMQGEGHMTWVHDAIKHTDWADTEILVIDLPAGCADSFLSVVNTAKRDLIGLIAVAQPNVVSGLNRVYEACAYHRLWIIGVIENMAGDVFGSGHVEAYCAQKGLKFYGSIPLSRDVREAQEKGDARLPVGSMGPVLNAATDVGKVGAEARSVRT